MVYFTMIKQSEYLMHIVDVVTAIVSRAMQKTTVLEISQELGVDIYWICWQHHSDDSIAQEKHKMRGR